MEDNVFYLGIIQAPGMVCVKIRPFTRHCRQTWHNPPMSRLPVRGFPETLALDEPWGDEVYQGKYPEGTIEAVAKENHLCKPKEGSDSLSWGCGVIFRQSDRLLARCEDP